MSDQLIRQLYRDGKIDRWHDALRRTGQLTIYEEPIGPPCMLEVGCAAENCPKMLQWSNCSYCKNCHIDSCMEEQLRLYEATETAMVNDDGNLEECYEIPCGDRPNKDINDLV